MSAPEPTYLPLDGGKIAELQRLKTSAEEEMADSFRALLDQFGQRDETFHCRYIALVHPKKFSAQAPAPDETTIVGITDEGNFFSLYDEGALASIPTRMKLHEWHEPIGNLLQNMGGILSKQPASELRTEFFSRKNTLSARLAGELERILTFVPTLESDETNLAIAYYRINGRAGTVQKYRVIDYSGASGNPITYGRGSSSAENPYEIVWFLCHEAQEKQRRHEIG